MENDLQILLYDDGTRLPKKIWSGAVTIHTRYGAFLLLINVN